jgi:hypothetical protein
MPEPAIRLPQHKGIALEVTPLCRPLPLIGRVRGVSASETSPIETTSLYSGYLRPDENVCSSDLSAKDLIELERQLRTAVQSGGDRTLVGLFAEPALESSSGAMGALTAGASRAGTYQLMQFPISRFNGIALPAESSIRFADPSRWFQGGMESRLFTISVAETNKYFSWDAHNPVGKTVHDFYHVNQKGMFNVTGAGNHAPLSGAALVQAKQLRYLKIGGRVFLVVGVIVDTAQMAGATVESFEKGSAKPAAAQAVRTAGGWAMAWAGAKAGMAVGALAGVETGPGMVLTAMGGGFVGGMAGYFGADWIADFIYEN